MAITKPAFSIVRTTEKFPPSSNRLGLQSIAIEHRTRKSEQINLDQHRPVLAATLIGSLYSSLDWPRLHSPSPSVQHRPLSRGLPQTGSASVS